MYLDKANTMKEKLLFLFSRNRKQKIWCDGKIGQIRSDETGAGGKGSKTVGIWKNEKNGKRFIA